MATRIGARAIHLGDLTGSLEPGKRADLIVVDLDQTHNVPRFERDPNAVYSQIVYAAKAADVVDVMCDGRWLMRDRRLLTLDENEFAVGGAATPRRRIDTFLTEREQSVLQKLVAIGGAAEQESFEVQIKARVRSADSSASRRSRATRSPSSAPCTTISSTPTSSLRRSSQGRLRYREDEFLDQARQRDQRPSAADADRTVARSRVRIGAAVPIPVLCASHALASFLSRVLQADARARRREGSAPLAGRVPRRPVLRARRSPAQPSSRGLLPGGKVADLVTAGREDKAAIITELLERLGVRPDETVAEDYVEL